MQKTQTQATKKHKNLGRIQFLDLNHGRSSIEMAKFDGFLNFW